MKSYNLIPILLISFFMSTLHSTSLINAIGRYDIEEIKRLLENNSDPNEYNTYGDHPLYCALIVQQKSSWLKKLFWPNISTPTQLLLNHGAKPNTKCSTKSKWSILDCAIDMGSTQEIKCLMLYGANPENIQSFHKKTSDQNSKRINKNIKLVQSKFKKHSIDEQQYNAPPSGGQ